MENKPFNLSLPGGSVQPLLLGIFMLVPFGTTVSLMIILALSGDFLPLILMTPLMLLFGSFVVAGFLVPVSLIHFVPQGIAFTVLGRTVRQIPVEDFRLMCLMDAYTGKHMVRMVVLSTHTLEELASLREQQILRNPITRHDLPFKKRNPNWQHILAGDYLKNKLMWFSFLPMNKDVLCFPWQSEAAAVLDVMYPNIPRTTFLKKPVPQYSTKPDKDPKCFCRGTSSNATAPGMEYIPIALAAVSFILPILTGGAVQAWFFLLLSGLFGFLWLLAGGEGDVIRLGEEVLTVTRGSRELHRIPSAEVQLLLRIDALPVDYILVSNRTPAQLASQEAAHLQKSHNGRLILSALEQLPDAERHLLWRYCLRWRDLGYSLFAQEILIADCHSRWEVLTEQYPQAIQIDLRDTQAIT